ncbi:MAG: polyprenyl synthetase family protein [Georgfuchsia sp.]
MPTDLCADWVSRIQSRTETTLDRLLPRADFPPQRLHAAMRHAMLGGGKRVRPLLCHATGEMFGASPAALDAAACAVELIHGYSLVHDDLPCMDNDVLRRGRPTCHVAYGEATALLAGDALQSLAFRTLLDAELQTKAMRLFADAAGSLGMAGGQSLDLDAVGQSLSLQALENMHRLKTGALIRTAVLLGAYCGQPGAGLAASADDEDIEILSRFADTIGLLFQVVDDILDAEASTETLGKTAGKDAKDNKPTYVSLMGLDAARNKAVELGKLAHTSLDHFSHRADRLHFITDYIAKREN